MEDRKTIETTPIRAEAGDIVKLAAWAIVAAITVGALYIGQTVLIPLAIAFLIGFALNPPVTWLTRRGLPRVLSTIVVMLTIGMLLAALGFLVASQVRALSAELPTYQSTIEGKIRNLGRSIRSPGIIDRALETVDAVQAEVGKEIAPAGKTPPAQRVEVVPPPQSPFKTALEWAAPALEPLATAGIVLIFVFLSLLDRGDLRDRLIRLLGGDIHRSTDAMEEAGQRISRYLLMQLMVNVSYGIPMALGLWLIGVPGWLLWGTLAALMRFVPYVGPMLSAIFPIALAFAVDPGWQMVIWTVALIVFLELVSNNVVEPLLYGTSTGLSAMSLIAAATFWTALWGPLGLILSTPLTVCLLVVGRSNPQLNFLDTLLGSSPVLDIPTRLYQRLIADDPEDTIEIADDTIVGDKVVDFYNDYGIEVLRKASDDYHGGARPEHRLRVANGMDILLDDLKEEYPSKVGAEKIPRIACIGGRWEIDSVACEMLVHALSLEGIAATERREGVTTARYMGKLDLDNIDIVCLSYFSREPETSIRAFCRRLNSRWPGKRILLALWNAPPSLLEPEALKALGADGVVTSIHEAVLRIERMIGDGRSQPTRLAAAPENDDARIEALNATHILDGRKREDLDALARRAAEVFDVAFAVVSVIDAHEEHIIGQSRDLPGPLNGTDMPPLPRAEAIGGHVVGEGETLVVSDTERDPRFSDNPAIRRWDTRFYAGTPLKTAKGLILGALCLFDKEPRKLDGDDLDLLRSLAADIVSLIIETDTPEPEPHPEAPPSTTVAQPVPE